ncbi:PilT protein-like protein [Candidatus Koribacter versatilis Ellin345]|uniref:PilT protein-like protein n=1 Tax=Koribacter versatilis (strain Ellin345) TaxID=204669 RepID=Q1INB3_KORVE|nr:type II toxin-antitoxin system VapC family toxin [Candidatus Koribacter versatilis]ABF41637.1 PilT protein-like protein [Candidatus Koribacter versatilis Ellin345]
MIVLDTHVALWAAGARERLSAPATLVIDQRGSVEGAGISAITLVEIAWLLRRGRLSYAGTIDAFLEKLTSRYAVLPITREIAALSAQFPPEYPPDPTDRLIGATALFHRAPLVTADRLIRASNAVHTIW